ncbi:MAG TPA: M24 family metallopeptidase, partial [Thermotogota bacterium]|nr:M24 family metallopeptidase [Thermotogota bacterium]
KSRFCSAEGLCIRWLETRLDEQMEVYHRVNRLAHEIIGETFSPERVYPGITTSQDLEWYMLERINSYGLSYWFPPDVYIHRKGKTTDGVIQRGDILHCDMGLEYFGLQSDTQRLAYCLCEGQTKTPQGLTEAFKTGNRFQDIVTSKFRVGATGNQIFSEAIKEARSQGIDATLYSHPIGIHGHGAGPIIGLYDKQEEIPVRGELIVHKNTCYALELNIKQEIPEWGHIKEGIYLEQTVGFDGEKVIYFDDRQKEFLLV